MGNIMILKLTNVSGKHQGKSILINMNYIISAYEDEIDDKPVTILYSKTQESWHVAEKLSVIHNQIKKETVIKL